MSPPKYPRNPLLEPRGGTGPTTTLVEAGTRCSSESAGCSCLVPALLGTHPPSAGTPHVCGGPSGCGAAALGEGEPGPAAVSRGAAQDRAQSRPCALRSAAQGKKTFLGILPTSKEAAREAPRGSRSCHRSGAGSGARAAPDAPQARGARWDADLSIGRGWAPHGGAETAAGTRNYRFRLPRGTWR